MLPDGTISLFDNQATPRVGDESRGLVLEVDERRRTATLVREFTHPEEVLAIAEGNAQPLPGGGMLIGWGIGRRLSELGADGELLFDVRAAARYRHLSRLPDALGGRPTELPRLAVDARRAGVTATRAGTARPR